MTEHPARTLYDKIWDSHVVAALGDEERLLYVDLHLLNEVMSPQAFEGLRSAGRRVRRPDRTLAVADHNVPTDGDRRQPVADMASRQQIATLEANVREYGVPYVPVADTQQGIVHVIGPELGMTHPGTVIVCADSHTSTHGAFGALAFGIGTSEVEHVLATQTLRQRKSRNMKILVEGRLPPGRSAKDLILTIIGRIGTGGATGHVIEYAGPGIEALSMEERMTVCNMSIEAGARAGLIAPDATTFAYMAGRRMAPVGSAWDDAVAHWSSLRSDADARYDRTVVVDAGDVVAMTTWGTSPDTAIPIGGSVPDPATMLTPDARRQAGRMLDYMGLTPGARIDEQRLDVVFIGSCTNGRLDDLRAAAAAIHGRRVAEHVRAMVVPGSGVVKAAAEAEGLDRIFLAAGFEWRQAGCSMCLGMNPDQLLPGQRCASTSNRNFEGRQGRGGRTHLVSPAVAAASAIAGHIVAEEEIV